MLLTWRRVARGTNGAVSALGLLATLLGGAAVGIAFALASYPHYQLEQLLAVLVLSVTSGVVGSVIDSILGGTLQYSGFCITCKKIINDPAPHPSSHRISQVAGTKLLSNDTVNFISALVGSIFAASFSKFLF